MQYVRFGNAGIEVSRLALGCMDFPVRLDEAAADGILSKALDQGVNFLDTADGYGNGKSEEVLGKLLRGRRDKVILATKFWVRMEKRPNGGGCSRVHIMQAVEASLRRLDTDYIDLYQLHHPDENTPVEEVISTLDALVKQGKIRYYGVSNHYAWQMAHMLGVSALHDWEPLVSDQCRYNILDRVIENEIVPFAQRFNIATMIYGPLDGGILTGKYHRDEEPPEDSRAARLGSLRRQLTEETFNAVDELKGITDEHGIELNQLAYAWLLSKPYVTSILMGGSKPEHFDQIYGVEDIEVSAEDLQRIDELSEPWKYGPFRNQAVVQGAPLALNRV